MALAAKCAAVGGLLNMFLNYCFSPVRKQGVKSLTPQGTFNCNYFICVANCATAGHVVLIAVWVRFGAAARSTSKEGDGRGWMEPSGRVLYSTCTRSPVVLYAPAGNLRLLNSQSRNSRSIFLKNYHLATLTPT